MKITISMISLLSLFTVACSTQNRNSTDYTWEVSITPVSVDAYELKAELETTYKFQESGTESVQTSTLKMPTLTLKPNVPAKATLEKEKTTALLAEGLLKANGEAKTVSYEMLIEENGLTHRTKGSIIIQ